MAHPEAEQEAAGWATRLGVGGASIADAALRLQPSMARQCHMIRPGDSPMIKWAVRTDTMVNVGAA
ncbi:hypothetical protein [Streptomyces sp. B21-083]|uniref:hypothetical protein n=1 Tax=Streptomyces sp. B21-083 TaxID=3039410 RepID=UPI002FF2CDD0